MHLDLFGARIDHPTHRRSRVEVLLNFFPKIGGIVTRRYDLNGEIGPAQEVLVGILQPRFSDEGDIGSAYRVRAEAEPTFGIDLSKVQRAGEVNKSGSSVRLTIPMAWFWRRHADQLSFIQFMEHAVIRQGRELLNRHESFGRH